MATRSSRIMRAGPLLCGMLAILLICFNSCERIHGETDRGVEIYLLEEFETIDQTCGIEFSSVTIKPVPLLFYEDLVSYDPKDYILRISDSGAEKIDALEYPVTGIAFAVTAEKEIIYTGYFWPAFSSLSCQWITIDPLMWQGENELRVELGYPGLLEGTEIPDERNNEKILEIFRRDGKLVE